jgi:hypothetical protein
MRKLIIWLGRIPGTVKNACRKALGITTKILQMLESRQAILITNLIPGEKDDALRFALIAVLKAFQPILEGTENTAARKALAARIGAELTAAIDGRKESLGQYAIWFEQTYQEGRA